ncbi:MAG: hypothetical protein NZ693_01865 [Thermoflexales bacterium]|nr:hypothetical protein [Thermoflexales bacterium]
MPRYIRDPYEFPGDEDLPLYEGRVRRRKPVVWPIYALGLVAVCVAAILGVDWVQGWQEQDESCVGCHTPQHEAYLDRARAAVAGAVPADLSSHHYQHLHGTGATLRCIDCHRGDHGTRARAETLWLSARMTARWLAGVDDRTLEKTTLTLTVRSGVTQTVPQTFLALSEPHLSNDGCVQCHQDTLLVAGMGNHTHNMLPQAYALWANGARLIPPRDDPDPQTLIARGLVRYPTTLYCSNCHQTHRSIDAPGYLDWLNVVKPACEQCHREVGAGPAEVQPPAGE